MTFYLFLAIAFGVGFLLRGLFDSDSVLVERLVARVRQLERERSVVTGVRR